MELFDAPPVGRGIALDWVDFDNNIIVLIDHPGKWGVVAHRDNVKYRSTVVYQARVGKGFQFSTRFNNDTGKVDVWACYHPEEA